MAVKPRVRDEFGEECERVVPLIEEELSVSKQEFAASRVLIHKEVREKPVSASDVVSIESVEIERVPVNEPVEAAVHPWNEDGMLVIPVYEERIVSHKQLFLKEKLRVAKRVETSEHPKTVVVREEEVSVGRSAPLSGATSESKST